VDLLALAAVCRFQFASKPSAFGGSDGRLLARFEAVRLCETNSTTTMG
jgi:hypothetical protein